MAAIHFRASHIRLIALHYARHMIRGGTGILFTLAALFAGLIIGAAFIAPVEELHKTLERERAVINRGAPQDSAASPDRAAIPPEGSPRLALPPVEKRELVAEVSDRIGLPVIQWAVGGDQEQAHFLVKQRPALVSAILMVMLFCLPFLVALGAFNQLSGDIQFRGLRYLLLRTERANIFLGRFIGTVVFTMAVLAIVLVVLFLYLAIKADFYPPGEVLLWLLQGYLALALFSLPFIALCSWISSALDGPFLSLMICQLVMIFPIIFASMASGIDPRLTYLNYVTPWPCKFTLLHPNPLYVLGAAADMLAFTGLFLFLGLRHFQTRDL